MANDIVSSELFSTNKSESPKETSKIAQEPKKEGNSLFDNLLKEAKAKAQEHTVVATKLQSSTEAKVTNTTIPNKTVDTEPLKQNPQGEQKTKVIPQTQLNNTKSSLSFLDKMAEDITKTTPKIDTKVIEEKITSTPQKPKSLLDKMAEDITKTTPKIDTKVIEEKVTSTPQKPKSLLDKMAEDITKATPLVKKIDSLTTKESSESLSLMDSMILEIQSKNEVTSEVQKENIKPTISTTINGSIQTKLNSNHNQLDSKKIDPLKTAQSESKTTLQDSKESKILSSLVESINGKTKIKKQFDSQVKLESLEDQKVQFGASAFLSNQKVQREILSQQKIAEAKEILKDGDKTTKTIKKSADILELNTTHIDIEHEEETKVTTTLQNSNKQYNPGLSNQKMILDRAFLTKETFNTPNTTLASDKVEEGKKVSAVEETKTITKDISITVERTLVETFTTKVIASKQMMGSFMSDVARNMYLNYKPPITAFKINLDPVNLGNISIIMRSNRSDNSLSISMNMSQNATYDTFNDNKAALQNAIGRSFNQNEANISLDFGMQNDNSNQEFERQREEQENKQTIKNSIQSQTILRENETSQEDLETTQSYM